MKLYLDTETYSDIPIKYGTARYTSECEVMILAWAIDDGGIHVEFPCGKTTSLFTDALRKADEIIAHNAMFDRNALKLPLTPQWRCTMARALAHSLPGGLDRLCEVLNVDLDHRKSKTGTDLIRLFCMPRPKTSKIKRATEETHPEEWAAFIQYAIRDIEALREIDKRLPTWNFEKEELALWHLDQRINERGFCVDTDLVNAAITTIDAEQERLKAAAQDMTQGEVQSATQRDAMLDHILSSYGVALPDLQASTLERRIDDPALPEGLKELLRIRLQASTSSTSKYRALLNGVTHRDRMRCTLQFCGASRTGRWAGRTFQPQNLPRPTLSPAEIEEAVSALKDGSAPFIYSNLMQVTSSTIRGCIVAPTGKKLIASDLANIEGRMLAWLAEEDWKIQTFADYDAGVGEDAYKLTYANSFKINVKDVTDAQRQIGKVQELALGYQGGVGAFLTFSLAYGINLNDLSKAAWDALPLDLRAEAEEFYNWTVKQDRSTYGLQKEVFITCDVLKRAWRRAHPKISEMWNDIEDACREAIKYKGLTIECGRLKIICDNTWLCIQLPSGRYLNYLHPALSEPIKGKTTITYMGVNQYTRKWCRLSTYGGKLVENITQASARDVIGANALYIESKGYDIVLTVHDEVITEAPDTAEFNVKHLSSLLADPPNWCIDLPLTAKGFEGYRYTKG